MSVYGVSTAKLSGRIQSSGELRAQCLPARRSSVFVGAPIVAVGATLLGTAPASAAPTTDDVTEAEVIIGHAGTVAGRTAVQAPTG